MQAFVLGIADRREGLLSTVKPSNVARPCCAAREPGEQPLSVLCADV
jgi:hypothetical protein